MWINSVVISLLLSLPAWAAVPRNDKAVYPAQRISARGIERIQITGVRGQLRLTGVKSSAFQLKVGHSKNRRWEDWNLLVERRGTTLFLEVASSAYGREWSRLVRQELWPEFDIELSGPPLPTVVSWREGSLNYTNWQAALDTSFLNGDVRIHGGGGRHVLQTGHSRVQVQHFKGDLKIQGDGGPLDLFALQGNLQLNWLHGQLTLTDVQSTTAIETVDATTHIHGGAGHWEMKTSGGSVALTDFGGQFKGHGGTTQWRVHGRLKSDLELVNSSGSVDVDWKSTARVFLTSDRGLIHSPYALQDRDGHRVSEGHKGSKPLGLVFVRTESGDITFKY